MSTIDPGRRVRRIAFFFAMEGEARGLIEHLGLAAQGHLDPGLPATWFGGELPMADGQMLQVAIGVFDAIQPFLRDRPTLDLNDVAFEDLAIDRRLDRCMAQWAGQSVLVVVVPKRLVEAGRKQCLGCDGCLKSTQLSEHRSGRYQTLLLSI